MSNFYCEKCGALIADSPTGYVSGCEHYPLNHTKLSSNNKIVIIPKASIKRKKTDARKHNL